MGDLIRISDYTWSQVKLQFRLFKASDGVKEYGVGLCL